MTFCEFAMINSDMRMVLAGTFTGITVTRPSDAAAPVEGFGTVALPPAFLVATVNASISEGLTHAAELLVLNDDNGEVFSPIPLGDWTFVLNPHGRPMRYQGLINVTGLALPGPGEYTFRLRLGGQTVGEVPLYVDLAPGT